MAVAAVVLRSPSRRSAGRSAWATTTTGGPAPPWWWRQSPSRHLRRSSRGGEGSRLSRSTTRAPRVRPAPWCGVALAFRAGAIRTTRTNDKNRRTLIRVVLFSQIRWGGHTDGRAREEHKGGHRGLTLHSPKLLFLRSLRPSTSPPRGEPRPARKRGGRRNSEIRGSTIVQ